MTDSLADERHRLTHAARELWGERWAIEALHFADGDTDLHAFSTTDHVADGVVIRERLELADDGFEHTRYLIDCQETIETIRTDTYDAVADIPRGADDD